MEGEVGETAVHRHLASVQVDGRLALAVTRLAHVEVVVHTYMIIEFVSYSIQTKEVMYKTKRICKIIFDTVLDKRMSLLHWQVCNSNTNM